jgi:hypothetical protein
MIWVEVQKQGKNKCEYVLYRNFLSWSLSRNRPITFGMTIRGKSRESPNMTNVLTVPYCILRKKRKREEIKKEVCALCARYHHNQTIKKSSANALDHHIW